MPDNILKTMIGILATLIISSLVTTILAKKNPDKDYSELSSRVKTWWFMAGIFCAALLIGREVSIAFFAFLSFLAVKEYFSMIETRRTDRRVLAWVYLAIPIQYFWVGIEWYGMFIIFIPVYLFLFIPFRTVLTGVTEGYISAIGTIHWGAMTMIFSLSHIAYLLVLPEINDKGGPSLVLFLVVLTQANDVFQYISGKMFGKHKIVPEISPKKTTEGFLGGVLLTTLLASLAGPFLTPLSLEHSILAGLIIAISGFIGDITISALKRDLGVKDSGSLLPGHGGILDRVDSLSYTAPLFFHFAYYLYY